MTPSTDSLLTAPTLRRALAAGARRVIAGRARLDRINVFPVADGDTGTNLAATVGSLLHGALRERSAHVGALLRRVGDDAIDGARGNSGAILAQFLHGVAEAAGRAPVLDPTALVAAVRHGAVQARGALAQPVEGTILSVIDRFAEALAQAVAARPRDPLAAFSLALDAARDALAQTPAQLPVLQRAGVVDAGGQGFVDLLEGVSEALAAGAGGRAGHAAWRRARRDPEARGTAGRSSADDRAAAGSAAAAPHVPHEPVDPALPWCTECLLLGEALDATAVRAALAAIGATSVVVAGGGARLRVHAHVAAPQALFDACAGFGAVEAMKADDMVLQARSVASPSPVALVVDSAADLPRGLAQRHAVHVVPVRITLDGRDHLDRIGLSPDAFYRAMAASGELPRTSQPPPGDFRRVFEFLAAHHAEVLYVGLSRGISGTLDSALQAVARLPADMAARVNVFDSVNIAGGQALLAWRAAELAAEGMAVPEIVAALTRLRPLTPTWAMARDIRHAVRGGRLPAWAGPAVRLSGLVPIARVRADGRLGLCGGLLARARAPEAFAAYVARRVDAGMRWRAIVGHCDAAADAARTLDALRGRLALVDAHLFDTGPAIGAHAGRGTLVVSLQPAPD